MNNRAQLQEGDSMPTTGRNCASLYRAWSLLLVTVASFGVAATFDPTWDAPIGRFVSVPGNEWLELCEKMQMPCGFEISIDAPIRPAPYDRMVLNNTTPKKIIAAIIAKYPAYHWKTQDGVLLLEPKRRLREDLLARRLEHVVINGEYSGKAVWEVLQQAQIRAGHGAFYESPAYKRVSMDLNNVTVRDALNAIVKADGMAMWIFESEDPQNSKASFRVETWRLVKGAQ